MQKLISKSKGCNENQLERYLVDKFNQSIIYGSLAKINLEDQSIREEILDNDFVDDLCKISKENLSQNIFTKKIKNHFFEIIEFLKKEKGYETQQEKKTLYEKYNFIIYNLNVANQTGMYDFYRKQLLNRESLKLRKIHTLIYPDNVVDTTIDSIDYAIFSDHDAISGLLYSNEMQFLENVATDNLVSHWFINTLNILFTEFPSIYKNEKFLERAIFILENSNLLIEGKESIYELTDEEIDDDIAFRTNKILKKLKKLSR